MRVGPRCYLRKVRYAHHLRVLREPPEAHADRGRGRSTDTRVDLIEDQRRSTTRAGEHDDQGQQNARELAARGNTRQRPFYLAFIGGKSELQFLRAARTYLFERFELHAEAPGRQCEVFELGLHRLSQPVCRAVTQAR